MFAATQSEFSRATMQSLLLLVPVVSRANLHLYSSNFLFIFFPISLLPSTSLFSLPSSVAVAIHPLFAQVKLFAYDARRSTVCVCVLFRLRIKYRSMILNCVRDYTHSILYWIIYKRYRHHIWTKEKNTFWFQHSQSGSQPPNTVQHTAETKCPRNRGDTQHRQANKQGGSRSHTHAHSRKIHWPISLYLQSSSYYYEHNAQTYCLLHMR